MAGALDRARGERAPARRGTARSGPARRPPQRPLAGQGPWELRIIRVDELADGLRAGDLRLRLGGWPLAGDRVDSRVDGATASVRAGGRISAITRIGADASAGIVERDGASPLGPRVAVPVLSLP